MSTHLHPTQSRPVSEFVTVFSVDFSQLKINESGGAKIETIVLEPQFLKKDK